ncbi:YdcF family protein [Neorhizobium sp. T786]|uniref:YdcF family protein n=1 Tax=Pseudorhizobium xiangyangii TaxID=2883104 RepID=UPI001CFF8830|nr:YdcF family protein [Neorhizobium xiangyangii]MCB5204468.1 YdcF family protein [Neorhizobium xiangyangii]
MSTTRSTKGNGSPSPPRRRVSRQLFSRHSRLRRTARWLITGVFVMLAAIFGGFLWFADSVASMRPPEGVKADAIVVLTGGYQRIDQAMGLLRDGAGKRLLISGAHPSTTPAQIRKMTQTPSDLFTCCVDVGYDALDTIGNASEISTWIHDNGFTVVLVVTQNYHMPRSLHELRRVDPVTEFIPYPVVNSDLTRKAWFTEPDVVRIMILEYAKVVVAIARDWMGLGHTNGLRPREKTEAAGFRQLL